MPNHNRALLTGAAWLLTPLLNEPVFVGEAPLPSDIRFQSLAAARKKVQETFGFDFTDVLVSGEWESACCAFQKRHLLAHTMGVIDEEYVQKTSDPTAVAGRKVHVTPDEVYSAISIVERLGRRLFDRLFSTARK